MNPTSTTISARKTMSWIAVAFAANLAGSLAVWGLAYWNSLKDDFPGEAFWAGVLIFGTLWAAIASFAAMISFTRTINHHFGPHVVPELGKPQL